MNPQQYTRKDVLRVTLLAIATSIISIGSIAFALNFIGEKANEQLADAQIDASIKNDIGRMLVATDGYLREEGRPPETTAEIKAFEENYYPDDFVHPVSELPYTIDDSQDASEYHIIEYRLARCGDEDQFEATNDPTVYAFRTELTNGDRYCLDNA